MTDADAFAAGDAPTLSRAEVKRRLEASGETEVLIIGGGINGVGVLRELAAQGIRCLLVEREDFGAGASSASSRMAHGGLRYLENGEFRLVAEATHERNRLLRNAPHYVVPLPITVPFFSLGAGFLAIAARALRLKTRVTERGLLLVAAGLRLYDWLGRRDKVLPRHHVGWRAETRRRFPRLHAAVRAHAGYYDAKILYPERLAFELVADAVALNPHTLALNHCSVVGREGAEVVLRDEIDGQTIRVRPRVVINAGGAWIDRINQAVAEQPLLIGGTKGSHLVIDNPSLHEALGGTGFLWDDGAGRMCIAYPHLGKVILGSTDIRIEDADRAVCEPREQEYLLNAIRVVFPMVALDASQVCYRFCGVRPLPRSNAATPSEVSRDHSIARLDADGNRPFVVYSLVGGKWTTFRAFSAQVADRILDDLGRSRTTGTEDMAIGGGRDYPPDAESRARWLRQASDSLRADPARMQMLFERYGTRALAVAAYCMGGEDRALQHASDYSRREIEYLIEFEMAVELEDLIYRRSTLALMGRMTEPLLRELAALLQRRLGWSEAETGLRVQRAAMRLSNENGARLSV